MIIWASNIKKHKIFYKMENREYSREDKRTNASSQRRSSAVELNSPHQEDVYTSAYGKSAIPRRNTRSTLTLSSPSPNESAAAEQLDGDDLIPRRIMELYPPIHRLVHNCTCTSCVKGTCLCRSNLQPCCDFCKCQEKRQV